VYGCEGIRVYGCLCVCVPEIYFRCTKIICFNRIVVLNPFINLLIHPKCTVVGMYEVCVY
jgi:hypothetical protein